MDRLPGRPARRTERLAADQPQTVPGIRARSAALIHGVKKIGFLSFGHWRDVPGSQTRSAADSLLQTVELAQAAEDIGVDGAFVRVHHFERQPESPFPLLAAIGARTRRIEIGTAVIDMR
jgi:luciferase-like monooxygenase